MTTPRVTTQASGSLILVSVLTQSLGTFAGLSDNKGNTYVNVGGQKSYADNLVAGSHLFAAENAVGGSGHTWSLIKAPGHEKNEATLFVIEIIGAPAVNAISAWSYLNSTRYRSAPVTTTAANELLVSFWGPSDYSGKINSYTPPTGWTKGDELPDSNNHNSGASAWAIASVPGSYHCTWTASYRISDNSSAWLVAVKPHGASP